ncbi:carbohydrate ABC transporter substrate-binding protein, partial [Paracoccaceae bacterium]|nr:carbohydrate ABC transporter substrate-binding protein [Paracoccaceae bacterium]
MFQKFIKLTTAFALSTGVAVPAYAELSGTLRITSDMSNPAPRAVMEKMAADF